MEWMTFHLISFRLILWYGRYHKNGVVEERERVELSGQINWFGGPKCRKVIDIGDNNLFIGGGHFFNFQRQSFTI